MIKTPPQPDENCLEVPVVSLKIKYSFYPEKYLCFRIFDHYCLARINIILDNVDFCFVLNS